MHEELVKALRFCAEKSNGWNCPACPGFDGLCSAGKEIRATAADAIREQSAQLTAKDADNAGLKAALARVTVERDGLRIYYNDISSKPDCNTCGAKNECVYRPRLGATVRANCPLWRTPAKQDKEG